MTVPRLKILIITDAWYPQVNGVVRTYEHISEELRNRGHEVKVIGPEHFPWCVPLLGYAEIKLVLAPYKHLSQLIEAYGPDKIHLSTEGPLGWAGRRYCLERGLPFSTSYHTQFPDYMAKRLTKFLPFLYKTVHTIGRKYVRTFHAPSSSMNVATQSLKDTLKSWGFKNPMHDLTRGANFDLFHTAPKTLFHDLPRPVALYVGRIAIEKNIEDFLAMPWEGSKVVVGDGPSRASLEKKYDTARFVGKKTGEDLAQHYQSADLFVFPSRTDTFGMVLVEAMACGLPVAGYNVTGPKDIITEPFLGALEDTDLGAAARKALTCGTPSQREAHAREFYTWERAGAQFEEALLRKVV